MSRDDHNPLNARAIDAAQANVASRSKLEASIADDDIAWLMGSKQGRRVMWGLLSECGVFRSSMTGNSYTFFNEGARNVGLTQLANIHRVCPERYAAMVKESKEAANG